MARVAQGWKLVWRRGIANVRFTHAHRRHELSTGSRDPGEAARIGAKIYSDVISGALRRSASGTRVHPATPLVDLVPKWITAIEPELGTSTGQTYTVYGGHWCAAMPTISDVTPAGIGHYQRTRLTRIQRSTLVKERSALHRFLTWLVEQESIAVVPEFPALPKKATGTRHKQGRSKPASTFTEHEAQALVDAVRGPSQHFFRALWETGLRPQTLELLVPADLTPFGLHIRAEVDKNRWERTIPISPAARAALAHLPFGEKDRRTSFASALRRTLGASRKATPYDLKHARITLWINQGRPLGGISWRTGVSIETLTEHYAHPSRRAAEWGHTGVEGVDRSCEGGDLNPHGSYPASTSSNRTPRKRAGYGARAPTNGPDLPGSERHSGAGPHFGIGGQLAALDAADAMLLAAGEDW